jgi:hypothetical protein
MFEINEMIFRIGKNEEEPFVLEELLKAEKSIS